MGDVLNDRVYIFIVSKSLHLRRGRGLSAACTVSDWAPMEPSLYQSFSSHTFAQPLNACGSVHVISTPDISFLPFVDSSRAWHYGTP